MHWYQQPRRGVHLQCAWSNRVLSKSVRPQRPGVLPRAPAVRKNSVRSGSSQSYRTSRVSAIIDNAAAAQVPVEHIGGFGAQHLTHNGDAAPFQVGV